MSKAREEYDSQIGGVLSHVWKREGQFVVCDPAETRTPLVDLLAKEDDKAAREDLDYLPADLSELRFMSRHKLADFVCRLVEKLNDERVGTLNTFLNYLFEEGPDMLKVLQRLFIYTRAAKRGAVWNMSLTEMAALFGHSKQNWQHLEEKLILKLVHRWGRAEFVATGGKSYAAKVAYSNGRKGNTHRRDGRSANDDLPPLPPEGQEHAPLTKRAKIRAEFMRQDAERKRIAAMCDCDPDDIDLRRISPSEE